MQNEEHKGYENVYQDTLYFVNALVDEYSFYDDVFKMMKRGNSTVEVKKKHLKKSIDEAWIKAIEDNLDALDNVLRLPGKEIVENEEILPIELTHKITARSVRHLAQHTDMISEIKDNGDIVPNKMLNVFHDETLMTYENKFINTLIDRLYIFVTKRYTELLENQNNEDCASVEFQSTFMSEKVKGKCTFHIELSEASDAQSNGMENMSTSQLERVKKINQIINAYMSSSFVAQMGKNYIRPPVMHTNAIMKNKDLYRCLQLWQFIESYENIGYEITAEESAEKPNDEYVKELYSMLALQYVIFRYNISAGEDKEHTVDSRQADVPLRPKIITEFSDLDAEEFTVYDSRYRKMVPISSLTTRKRLNGDEQRIRVALDTALAADRLIEKRKADAQRKAKAEAMELKRAAVAKLRVQKSAKRAEEKEKRALEKQLLKVHKKSTKSNVKEKRNEETGTENTESENQSKE